ncbi:MAG: hypothetical protein AMS24_01410 [Chlamydiae bacterium SM23_39]|nr:MAG: hypothetical protein AMS24_01410 [Chlamydiae bacterium SM23_39]
MKKYFLAGLIILLPLTITIFAITFIVNFLTKPFMGMVTKYLSKTQISKWGLPLLTPEQIVKYGSQLIIILGILLFTIFLGYIARLFFIKSLVSLSDKILKKIPLVNKVYKTSQEIINTLFITDKNSFKQVVLVPFPSPNIYGLGLISKESPKTCSEKSNSNLISVFVPTTPNPTSGFLLMYKKEDLLFIDMKTEDAIKYIISCGVVTPKKRKK